VNNVVNDLGESNFFEDGQDTDSDISQLSSSLLGQDDGDESFALVQVVDSSVPTSDVSAELDLLLVSLQLATPQPPQKSTADARNSIANIRSRISTVEPVTHSQHLLQELNDTRDRLTAAQIQLQLLHRRNQAQVDRVDINTIEVKQIKSHTQQLAHYSKIQVATIRELLDKFDLIRMEIVATLDKFGGYEQMRQLLVRLETTHQHLTTDDRTAFEESLEAIRREVTAYSHDFAAKLSQYQDSVESLAQEIAIDRLQAAQTSAKIDRIDDLGDRMTAMHDRVVEKSQTLQSKIAQIEQDFVKLSQSIESEKEQFYELTVETIEKADLLRSQLTQLANQIDDNRATISQLQGDIALVHESTSAQIERHLDSALSVRDRELLAICDDLHVRHQRGVVTVKKLSTWLWILSVAVGTIFLLLLWVVVTSKKAAIF
jgi:chromosome segregation ATPase